MCILGISFRAFFFSFHFNLYFKRSFDDYPRALWAPASFLQEGRDRTTNMGAPPHCSSPAKDHVLPRRGYSQRLVYLLHRCAMSNRHCCDPPHSQNHLILVVWWCPVRQSLNLLAFYPLDKRCIGDRNYRIIREPEREFGRKKSCYQTKHCNKHSTVTQQQAHNISQITFQVSEGGHGNGWKKCRSWTTQNPPTCF